MLALACVPAAGLVAAGFTQPRNSAAAPLRLSSLHVQSKFLIPTSCVGVAAAKLLKAREAGLPGTVLLLFQPGKQLIWYAADCSVSEVQISILRALAQQHPAFSTRRGSQTCCHGADALCVLHKASWQ